MKMIDRLPGVPAAVDHRPETVFIQPLAFGHPRRPEEEHSQRLLIGIDVGGDMLFRNDQEMNRRLGMNVLEGHAFFVLVEYISFLIA